MSIKQHLNFFIMSDEHAPMYSGPYGHPFVQTPHMDKLAEDGVTFTNAYCNSPLCMPSRPNKQHATYQGRNLPAGIRDPEAEQVVRLMNRCES